MIWRRNKNICAFWDCKKRIPDDDFLCDEHQEKWVAGLIDRCPKCGRFKDIAYQLCQDCYFGRPVSPWEPPAEIPVPKRQYKVEYSDVWEDGYLRPDKFFVYILELDEGDFYIGHTADLTKQLSEHRDSEKSATAGRSSKLQYLQIVATQKAAELREVELKRLMLSNPEQIRLMIADFRLHMRELGYKQYS